MSIALGLGAAGLALSGVSSIANFWQQHQNLDYQKGLQQDIFSREDSSIRRRVADLKAAGLSPVLAAGQGASAGQAIRTDPPQIEGNPLQDAMQLMKMKQEIGVSEAQRKLLESQNRIADANARYAKKDADIYTGPTGIDVRRASGLTKEIKDLFNLISGVSKSEVGGKIRNELPPAREIIKDIGNFLTPESVKQKEKNKQFDDLEQRRMRR